MHSQRGEHRLLHVLTERNADDALDDQTEYTEVRVTVLVPRSRLEVQATLRRDEAEELRLGRDVSSGKHLECPEIAEATGVLQQIEHADRAAIVWEFRHPATHVVVQCELAALHQHERRKCGERLRGGAQVERRTRGERASVLDARNPIPAREHDLAATVDADGTARRVRTDRAAKE